jgi:hypothetical protein
MRSFSHSSVGGGRLSYCALSALGILPVIGLGRLLMNMISVRFANFTPLQGVAFK